MEDRKKEVRRCKSCGDVLPEGPEGKRGPKREYCSKVTCNAQYRKKKKEMRDNGEIVSFQFTRIKYGWSKYGGANMTVNVRPSERWYCQSCGERQSKDMGAYIAPLNKSGREFGFICAKCKRKAIENSVIYFKDVKKLVKRPSII